MGTLSVVQQLVEALDPKEIDQTLEDGKTALMLACKMGRPMTTKLLLDAKADVRAVENDGGGLLSYAKEIDDEDKKAAVLAALAEHGLK